MQNKVLLLLADGMRPDFIPVNEDPFVFGFLKESVFTMEGKTVMPSVTLPCHMSLFHSVAPDRHGILTNTYVPQVRPVKGLCEVLSGAGKRCGFFYDWPELRDLARPESLNYSLLWRSSYEKSIIELTNEAIKSLKEDILDFMFVYFGYPDSAGHGSGFKSGEYKKSVQSVWENIKKIKEALPDDFGMIVTADHGGHDRGHGSDCYEDMTIPIIFNGDVFKNIDKEKIKTANIIDIAPTITNIMGVASDIEWEGVNLTCR